MIKKRVACVLGTRPEAIKLAPVILDLKSRTDLEVLVISSGQHQVLLDQVLELFGITPDRRLGLMQANQSLESFGAKLLSELPECLRYLKIDLMVVQGDTSTAFYAALCGYYLKIPVAHVEAGLRTMDKYQPFPEEINRRLISEIAEVHFAPTFLNSENLLREGVDPQKVFITGNTVIDALLLASLRPIRLSAELSQIVDSGNKLLLVTAHRRENFGAPMESICEALLEISAQIPDLEIVFPAHPNPNVQQAVVAKLSKARRIKVVPPLDYGEFVKLLSSSSVVLTDSGGIQEEAPGLGKPVLVLRNTTERPEAVNAGVVRLVGTDKSNIVSQCLQLLTDDCEYQKMAGLVSPYGDGKAASRIGNIIQSLLGFSCEILPAFNVNSQ